MSQKWKDRLLYAVVLIVGISAVVTGTINARLTDTQKEIDRTQECTTTGFIEVLEALNERTSLSSELNLADRARISAELAKETAFNKVVEASLQKTPPTDEEARKIVGEYGKRLQESLAATSKYLGLAERQAKLQKENQYPTVDEFVTCLKNAKE